MKPAVIIRFINDCLNIYNKQIKQGGKVPESYFLSELSDEANMKIAVVTRGDKHELKFKVEKPHSVLR